jgi:hypothetical protein
MCRALWLATDGAQELMALARAHFLKYADKELYATTKALPVTEGLAVHLNPKLWTSAREAIGLVTIAPKADGHDLMRSYAWSSKTSVHEGALLGVSLGYARS